MNANLVLRFCRNCLGIGLPLVVSPIWAIDEVCDEGDELKVLCEQQLLEAEHAAREKALAAEAKKLTQQKQTELARKGTNLRVSITRAEVIDPSGAVLCDAKAYLENLCADAHKCEIVFSQGVCSTSIDFFNRTQMETDYECLDKSIVQKSGSLSIQYGFKGYIKC